MVQITAAAVHQTRNQSISRRPGTGHGAAQRTGTIVQIDGFVTVLFYQALHIRGDDIVGFFPTNTLKLTFTASTYSFHRIFQAVGIVNAATHRTPTQARAHLVQSFVIVIPGIIRFDIFDFAVHYMHTQWTAAATVNSTGAPYHLFV